MSAVILIGPQPPPSGGVASHMDDLARALRAEGERAEVIGLGGLHGSRAASAARLAGGLGRARLDGALVHLHTNGHNPGSWRLATAVALAVGGRAFLTLHSGLAPPFVRAHHRACRRTAAAFRGVVCVSAPIAEALLEAGIAAESVLVAPAFSPSALPLPLAPAGMAALSRRCDPLVVAALARGPEYGTTVLLDGFALLSAALPRAGLALVGPGVRDISTSARIEALGLRGRVHQLGDLSRAEALGAIAAADLFVRPTLVDGDAISVREALALGRRVVASDAAPRPAGVLTFASGRPDALAAAVLAALAEPRPAPPSTVDHLAPVLTLYRTAWRTSWPAEWQTAWAGRARSAREVS